MSDDSRPMRLPPFSPDYRVSGVLLHVTSLPSPYGIGDVGPAALRWVDRLHEADQRWWQVLPLGPTGYGNSPYQSLSSFIGNWLLISPDRLIEDGLLRSSDCEDRSFSATTVDYDVVIPFKRRLLERAWTNFSAGTSRELFLLDEQRRPRVVAGVPPDDFSSEGQLWGNPIYDWDALRRTGYRWWLDRLRALLAHVDVIRLDHFRAFAAAWHIPAGATTAQSGQWVPGPGADFFNAVKRELGVLPFIAEDLGLITPDVSALRDEFHVPGTRVLQFAFDGHSDNPYLPHNYVPNTVVYTGTHDNPTSRGRYEELPPYQRQNLWRYLKSPEGESGQVARDLIRLAWSSSAALAVAPLQDLLNFGPEARMNVPGRAEGNWSWRCTEELLSAADFHSLRELTRSSNRTGLRSPSEMAEAAS